MNAWTRVSGAEIDREGRRRVLFLRWKKAVFVIWFIWGRNERESEGFQQWLCNTQQCLCITETSVHQFELV